MGIKLIVDMSFVIEAHLTRAINSGIFPRCSFVLKNPGTSLKYFDGLFCLPPDGGYSFADFESGMRCKHFIG